MHKNNDCTPHLTNERNNPLVADMQAQAAETQRVWGSIDGTHQQQVANLTAISNANAATLSAQQAQR